MEPLDVKRRLTCILAADAVGYSRMMSEDETGTVRILSAHRAVIDGIIAFHNGRIVGTAGDSVLAEFGSAVEAVRCAVEIQEALKTRNEALPENRRMLFRVGVNLGDVVVKGEDLLGDGVNVAARLEGIAEPGGVCIASSVYDQITGKLDLGFVDIGEQNLKNISRPIRVYRVAGAGALVRPPAAPAAPAEPAKRGIIAWAAAGAAAIVVAALAVAWQSGWLAVGPTTTPVEQAKAPGATDAAKRHAEVEADLTRARAEAEAAALRASAEADAARSRAEADAVLAKAQAAAATARAQSEAQKIRSAADAEVAIAEKARREAEAKVAAMAARPAPPSPAASAPVLPPAAAPAAAAAPATSAPAIASAGTSARADAAPRPASNDGPWTIGRSCEAFGDLPPVSDRWRVTVKGGEFDIERGARGEPGYWHVTGKPTDDGRLVLAGGGVSRAQRAKGRQVTARFEGRLVDGRYVLNGTFGGRNCTLTLARAGG